MTDRAITREDLYALVWREPLKIAAARLDMAPTPLGQLCDRHRVPRPPQGYWTRIAMNLPVTTLALPAVPALKDLIPLPAPCVCRPFRRGQVTPNPELKVPRRLLAPHPIVANWIDERRRDVAAGRPVYVPHLKRVIDPRLPGANERRRYLVADTLFKSLERQQVAIASSARGIPILRFADEEVEFQVRYRLRRAKRPLTADEVRWAGPDAAPWKFELVETDTLVCAIRTWLPGGARSEWADTRSDWIEDCLGDVQGGIFDAFAALRDLRATRLADTRRLEAEQQERREREKSRVLEVNRYLALVEQAGRWRDAALARSFVAALRSSLSGDTSSIGGMRIDQWLDWADRAISANDPLAARPTAALEAIAAAPAIARSSGEGR